MSIDPTVMRSRRALLVGAVGGLTALAATALRPLRVAGAADAVRYVNDETDLVVLAAESAVGEGASGGAGTGIQGRSVHGIGVQGLSDSSYGVQGLSDSNNGVYGCSESGIGVHGSSVIDVGVVGFSDGEVGVHGESMSGRGGRFVGARAQIRLVPQDLDRHPDRGEAGDLFVDRGRRLWFCRGGTEWVRVA